MQNKIAMLVTLLFISSPAFAFNSHRLAQTPSATNPPAPTAPAAPRVSTVQPVPALPTVQIPTVPTVQPAPATPAQTPTQIQAQAAAALQAQNIVDRSASPAAPVSSAPIFQSDSLITGFQIEAPFTDLYTQSGPAFAAFQNGQAAANTKSPKVIGKVTLPDGTVFENVSVTVRGNSSRLDTQCPFAKLELEFSTPTTGTLLNGQKKMKIGTHCGETDVPTAEWGRIANQKEPLREAFIYTVLKRVGVTSLLSRPAIITYHDTSATVDPSNFPSNPLTRNAFFLEDEGEAAKRYGGTIIQKASPSASAKGFIDATTSGIDPLEVTLAIFAETMAENYDWYVKMSPNDYGNGATGLGSYANWNINIISNAKKQPLIQVYDWDIAGWVRGPSGQDDTVNAAERMSSYSPITPAVIAAAKKQFLDAKSDIYQAFQANFANSTDTDGVQNIQNHLDSFYNWISSSTQ